MRSLSHASIVLGAILWSSAARGQEVAPSPPVAAVTTDGAAAAVEPGVVFDPAAGCRRDASPEVRFQCGSAAAEAGYWDLALAAFQQLYDDTHSAVVLFNVAVANQSLGQHLEARDAFARVMGEHAAELDDPTRIEVARQFGLEAARVARLRVLDLPVDESVRVRFDGRAIALSDARPLVLEANAGPHALTVMQLGHQEFAWEGALAAGQSLEVRVELPLVPERPRELWEDVPFWVGMFALAGALAGGIVAGVVLQDDAQLTSRGGFTIHLGG